MPIYINSEMFNQKEQDEIRNNFLDAVKVGDYLRELKEERRNCKCKDCKKHERYSTLYELSLPENIINNIYGFAYFCRNCEKRQFDEEKIEGIIRRNILHVYDVDRLIFSIKHDFPTYDRLKNCLFKTLSMKRYNRFRWVYADWMIIKNINIRSKINDFGFEPDRFIRDFNKIVGTLMNKPEFVLMD